MSKPRSKIALVLAGGAARGAYEAGVLKYILDGLLSETGVRASFDIICGTSVGALNACFLGAWAHRPDEVASRLVDIWCSLRVQDVVQLGTLDLMRFGRSLLGVYPKFEVSHRRSGLIDPSSLERLVLDSAPWSFISRNIEDRRFESLAVSATHVASGRTIVFVQRKNRSLPAWSADPFVHAVATTIRPQHALASAALPLLFPAVMIDGHYYCDGGVRQNTPLSPALKLGAERVLVVSLRHVPVTAPEQEPDESHRPSIVPMAWNTGKGPSPWLLIGKVLNALWLDHVHYDLERMEGTNRLLSAGQLVYGNDFGEKINQALTRDGMGPLRSIAELRVQPSQNIGEIAASFVRDEANAKRWSGWVGTLLRKMAQGDTISDADFLSYLLFDGEFCRQLVQLGIDDARAKRDELARFFDEAR